MRVYNWFITIQCLSFVSLGVIAFAAGFYLPVILPSSDSAIPIELESSLDVIQTGDLNVRKLGMRGNFEHAPLFPRMWIWSPQHKDELLTAGSREYVQTISSKTLRLRPVASFPQFADPPDPQLKSTNTHAAMAFIEALVLPIRIVQTVFAIIVLGVLAYGR